MIALLALVAAAADPAVGFGLGVGTTGPGSGIPVDLSTPTHLGAALTLRVVRSEHLALDAGFGVPLAGEGASVWSGAELDAPLLRGKAGVIWALAAPGLQLGFVGPGYYARHDDVFVGWEYIYSGPVTPSLRLPLGVGVRGLRGHVDVTAELLSVLGVLPGLDLHAGGLLGIRFYP